MKRFLSPLSHIYFICINLRGTSWKDKNKALVLKKRSISIKFFFIILYETISIISRKRTANLNGFSSINHSITLRVNFFTSTRQAPFGSQLWNGASRIRVGLIELCGIFLTRGPHDNPWPILTRFRRLSTALKSRHFALTDWTLTAENSVRFLAKRCIDSCFRGRLILGNLMLLEICTSIYLYKLINFL